MALPSLSLLGKGRERENLAVSSNIRILFKGFTFVFFWGGGGESKENLLLFFISCLFFRGFSGRFRRY